MLLTHQELITAATRQSQPRGTGGEGRRNNTQISRWWLKKTFKIGKWWSGGRATNLRSSSELRPPSHSGVPACTWAPWALLEVMPLWQDWWAGPRALVFLADLTPSLSRQELPSSAPVYLHNLDFHLHVYPSLISYFPLLSNCRNLHFAPELQQNPLPTSPISDLNAPVILPSWKLAQPSGTFCTRSVAGEDARCPCPPCCCSLPFQP